MNISYDDAKRRKTLEGRGLDFAHADHVFQGKTLQVVDDRFDYGEVRYQTMGMLNDRLVMVVWTLRDEARHIISMRKCNDREQKRYRAQLGRP
jgi:uncharacterized DUF497 family protein